MSRITNDPLVAFLYELTRDHVSHSTVARIVQYDSNTPRDSPWRLTDEDRALDCEDLARILRCRDPLPGCPMPNEQVKP